MNNINSELEWLFYNLWTKVGPSPPKFSFSVPETVFYRHGRPESWYFTNKEGIILKKNKFNVNQKMIHQKFTKKISPQDQVVATSYNYQKDSPFLDLYMDHIPVNDFRTYIFFTLEEQEKPTALQKFVFSKTSCNQMIRCHFSQAISIVERQTNNYKLNENKIPLEDRTATFEGPSYLSKSENIVSNNIVQEVNAAVQEIEEHMFENSGVRLLSGIFYFKIDKADGLVLIFATNIKIDKVDKNTNDGIEIRLKLASQLRQQNELPSVNSQIKSSFARPQSNYGMKKASSNRLKVQECPFCDVIIDYSNEAFDVNIQQIQKIWNFHKDNADFPVELIQNQNDVNENLRINILFKVVPLTNQQIIPKPILKIHPNLTFEKYTLKKTDPLFLYESVKICEKCYQYVRSMIEYINFQLDERPSRTVVSQTSSKNFQFSNKHIASHTESLNSDQLSQKSMKPYLMKQQMKAQSTQFGQQHSSTKNHDIEQVLKQNRSSLTKRSGSEKGSASDQDYQKQQFTNYNQYTQRRKIDCQLFTQSNNYMSQSKSNANTNNKVNFNEQEASDNNSMNESQLSQSNSNKPPQNQAMMMFSKVEQGKEIASYVKLNEDSELQQIQEVQQNLEQSHLMSNKEAKRKSSYKDRNNFQRVMGQQAKNNKDTVKNLPKIDWEKEYQQNVRQKVEKAKSEIFKAVDYIESGKYENLMNDSLDLKLQEDLNISRANDISSDIMKIEQAYNMQQSTYHQQPQVRPYTNQDNSMFDKFYDSAQKSSSTTDKKNNQISILDEKIRIPKDLNMQQSTQSQRQFNQLFNVSQQKGALFSQVYKENISNMQNQITKARIQPQKRIRPMSSKPPINKNNQGLQSQQINIDFDTEQSQITRPLSNSAKKPSVILNNEAINSNPDLRMNQNKKQPKQRTKSANRTVRRQIIYQGGQEQQPVKKQGGGLFDFQNMTEKDIEQIAENADTLIQIIQNIKGNVAVPVTTSNQSTLQDNYHKQNQKLMQSAKSNFAQEACIEEEDEEDCTQEEGLLALESERSKRNNNNNPTEKNDGTWW
ncbi:UNKNOWN [Stylonychia lemnae]|uniref:Uncharacterized protein n=1 Tax=Stylonychia lemnae TaxID=5949 RepID=A0A078BB27_STYLE|nr:UNKNOWN [Stylonychia lemnae]|eukprot:CDW91604.1 UNKNOWN [Stylonychia lemnae]